LTNSNPAPAHVLRPAVNGKRAVWLKRFHQWHWISSAICLMAMLLFSVTGITLNHAAQIESKPQVVTRKAQLPQPLIAVLEQAASAGRDEAPLPAAVKDWAEQEFGVRLAGRSVEWSADEAYVPLPRPGGDAWLRMATDGEVEYEVTDRGWISWLNDLHKGRHTGAIWNWFIDLFAAACIVFCLTGFLILKMHAASRPSTWPMVGLGVVLPAVLALLFIH
jgi:hypothetical protein